MASGKQARRQRRAAALAALTTHGVEPGLAAHMYDNQIEPQITAGELRTLGLDIDTAMVSVDPGAGGHEISCLGCGATARLPYPLPEGKQAICPACQRSGLRP